MGCVRSIPFVFCLVASVWLSPPLSSASQPAPTQRQPHEFLRTYIGFTDEEIHETEKGAAIVRLLDTPLKREIAVFGIVWIEAPIDFYIEEYEDIQSFEKGSGVLKVRKLSDPPLPEDFAQMNIPTEDLRAIPKCKVGDCEVKIGEDNLIRLQTEIDWNAPDATERANSMVREMVLSYLNAYQEGGNQALAVYRDKKRPSFVAEEFRGLLENSPYLPVYLPEFHRYLLEYPRAELPGSADFFYWSENEFGLKPIIRLNHVTVYRPTEEPNGPAAIASKQLYCSHYFHTALELRFLVKDTAHPDASGFYLMMLNRSRSDGLTGMTGFFAGRTIRNRTRDGQKKYLELSKRAIESAYHRRGSFHGPVSELRRRVRIGGSPCRYAARESRFGRLVGPQS